MSVDCTRRTFDRMVPWSVASMAAILVAALGACMTASDHPEMVSTASGLASVESQSSLLSSLAIQKV